MKEIRGNPSPPSQYGMPSGGPDVGAGVGADVGAGVGGGFTDDASNARQMQYRTFLAHASRTNIARLSLVSSLALSILCGLMRLETLRHSAQSAHSLHRAFLASPVGHFALTPKS